MVVISKFLFYEKISENIKCTDIHYWNRSCVKGNLFFSRDVFLGSLKFFLPVYIVKAILKHKQLKDEQFLRRLLVEEIRSAVYGVLMANLFLTSNCILCKLCGRINYYNVGLISGIISGFSLLVETKENKTLDTLIFFNLLIDAAFRNMDFHNILKLTNTNETLMFMIVSGLLMHVLQNRKGDIKFTNFWFYTPKRRQDSNEMTKNKSEQKCEHKLTCVEFALQGTQKYFLLGYIFNIVRKLIPKMLAVFKKPSELLSIVINKENLKFGTFIGAYVGLYRYIICFLLKTKGLDPKYHGAIAGLFSGATYFISPSIQVLTVGITTLLQMFYHYILKSLEVKNKFLPQQIIYMLSHGILFHNALVSKETCPPYYINMLNVCTNNLFFDIYNRIILKHIL